MSILNRCSGTNEFWAINFLLNQSNQSIIEGPKIFRLQKLRTPKKPIKHQSLKRTKKPKQNP